MMNFSPRLLASLAAAFTLSASGCRDASGITRSAAQPAPRSITPRTTVITTGANAVVTLVLDVRGDVGKIGSFTGRLRYDPAALAYAGEVELADGTLRASNPGVGEIRVAGSSAAGIETARLAAFRFTVRNAAALKAMQFDLEEVHELSHVDLQRSVQRWAPRPFP